MSTTRPRRPDGIDEYVNRQPNYYDYNNGRIGRPSQYHYLRLTWIENEENLEYTLRFNTSRPGFWISSSPQKGLSRLRIISIGVVNSVVHSFVHRNHDKVELQSIFRNNSSDESGWRSYGFNILPKFTRKSIIFNCCFT